MNRKDGVCGKNPQELDLAGLTELCANVAINRSASRTQTNTAHAWRMEWIRLSLDHSSGDGEKEAEASLRKRILEFLSDIPGWMMSGV